MKKKILVFSNGEKIGDAIIKLPLLYEIKKRLPDYYLIWVTNLGSTAFNCELKNIASQYIDEIIERVDLKPFFWQNISDKYDFTYANYDYIFDTQKAVYRTLALKRIKCNNFISATANGFFSTIKINKKNKFRNYYLNDLFDLLNLIKSDVIDRNFKINVPILLEENLNTLFEKDKKYIGIAPGAGEKNKIWPLEKFIQIGKFYQNKNYGIVLYLGPQEINLRDILLKELPGAIIPEEKIKNFSNIEIVMASTKFLSCALANDSGISHMLSTKYCPLIKLFGPKNSSKFTPHDDLLITISSSEFKSKNVSLISLKRVLGEMDRILS